MQVCDYEIATDMYTTHENQHHCNFFLESLIVQQKPELGSRQGEVYMYMAKTCIPMWCVKHNYIIYTCKVGTTILYIEFILMFPLRMYWQGVVCLAGTAVIVYETTAW